MNELNNKEIWFVTGSQHLYGPDTLKQVAADSARIAAALDKSPKISRKVVFKPVLTTPESIYELWLAVQRLMAKGYGFGAEGDWKTAALVRSMKVMAHGLKGGTSFMEDYTCNFDPKGIY